MILEVTTKLSYRYLMNKSKSYLAYLVLEQADLIQELRCRLEEHEPAKERRP